MARPDFTAQLAKSYHSVMTAYICQKRGSDVGRSDVSTLPSMFPYHIKLIDRCQQLAAERALFEYKTQVDASITEKFEALSKVAGLESSVAALLKERDELSAHTKDAVDAAQGRVHKLEEELARLSSEHLRSGAMVLQSLPSFDCRYTYTTLRRRRKTVSNLWP